MFAFRAIQPFARAAMKLRWRREGVMARIANSAAAAYPEYTLIRLNLLAETPHRMSRFRTYPRSAFARSQSAWRSAMDRDDKQPDKLRELATWYRDFAERAENPMIWESRLRTAGDLDAEAERIERSLATNGAAMGQLPERAPAPTDRAID